MSFQLVLNPATMNDLERRNSPQVITSFHRIRGSFLGSQRQRLTRRPTASNKF